MTIDLNLAYEAAKHTADRACDPHIAGLQGSAILAIAGEVRQLIAQGKTVHNLTIGDFNPSIFPIPDALRQRIKDALDAGQTNYPPAIGTTELRQAIVNLYKRELDLAFPIDSIITGSGARPPIYAAMAALLAPGDVVLYPVPSWNVGYYVYLNHAEGVPMVTQPEHGFMPTAEAMAPHLSRARLLVINSPQNPSGSVIAREQLQEICDAIVAENRRRDEAGERPLFLLYDSVYWRLTFGDAEHVTPMALSPEMAPYTIIVDAISKWWAATGLRVGWAAAPPWIVGRMKALIGHMGAWAGRPEQMATAALLEAPEDAADYLGHFKRQIKARLETIQRGIEDMNRDGLPISCLDVAGAIYLSVKVDLIGKTTPNGRVLEDDEAVRSYLLHEAGVAVVPFTAFGYPEKTGWLRMSVGSVSMEAVQGTLDGLRQALSPFRTE